MKLAKWLLTVGFVLALGVQLGVPRAWTQAPASEKPAFPDVSKYLVVEKPVTALVVQSAPATAAPAVPADPSKRKRVEPAVSSVVAGTAPASTSVTPTDLNNPIVEPGKVKWHKTLAEAQAASEKSGKPVLLFHMMGQLDKQFC
jgi:hypothetical protein